MKKYNKSIYDKFPVYLYTVILANLSLVIISSVFIPGFNSSILFFIMNGIIFLINSICIVLYFMFIKKLKIKRNILIFIFLAIVSALTTLITSQVNGFTINSYDYLNIPIRFMNLISFVLIPSSICISNNGVQKFLKCILYLSLIACFYNVLLNFNNILGVASISKSYAVDFKSFYLNRNTFGQLLFISIIANTVLYEYKKKKFYKFMFVLILVNLFLTFSRGAISSVLIFLVFYFKLWDLKKLKRNRLFVLTGLITIIIFFSSSKITNFFKLMLVRIDSGLSGREIVWKKGLELISNSNLFFGIGNFTAKEIIYNLFGHLEYHSFFIETLVSGGIIELILYIILFIFILRKILLINSNDKIVGSAFISGYISVFFYSLIESVSFVSIGYVDTIFMIFFITIPIMYSNVFKLKNYE